MGDKERMTPPDRHPGASRSLAGVAGAGRPILLWAICVGIVVGAIRLAGPFDPLSPLFRYVLEACTLLSVGIGAAVAWWAAPRGRTLDADVIAALTGALATLVVLGMLHDTPWGLNGIGGDAAFRTESITRFADSPASADFMQRGLPAYYAPAFFWILGRTAALLGHEPWLTLKYGTILVAALIPLATYLSWRLIVPARVAALLAIVPLAVELVYEPYAWFVFFAIVPWWILTVPGIGRDSSRLPHPVVLGVIGGLLFMTYYYFFFAAAIATGLFIASGVRAPTPAFRARLRPIAVSTIAAVLVAAPFWVPLAVSLATAADVESWANRWFSGGAGEPDLPFLRPDPVGIMSLAGVLWLLVRAREPLARALLTFLAAAAVWYLIGLPAAIAGAPILAFRIYPLITMVLVCAGILAAAELAAHAAARSPAARLTDVRVAALALAAVVSLAAAHGFLTRIAASELTRLAHTTPLPDGSLPRHAPPEARPATVAANAIRDALDSHFAGPGHAVIVSTRADVLALNPYYGFVQWQVYYAHPASQFRARMAFLRTLAAAGTPVELARLCRANSFEPIDAFVLEDGGDTLAFRFRDDNFPYGAKPGVVEFPRMLFASGAFEVVDLGDVVVAIRR